MPQDLNTSYTSIDWYFKQSRHRLIKNRLYSWMFLNVPLWLDGDNKLHLRSAKTQCVVYNSAKLGDRSIRVQTFITLIIKLLPMYRILWRFRTIFGTRILLVLVVIQITLLKIQIHAWQLSIVIKMVHFIVVPNDLS